MKNMTIFLGATMHNKLIFSCSMLACMLLAGCGATPIKEPAWSEVPWDKLNEIAQTTTTFDEYLLAIAKPEDIRTTVRGAANESEVQLCGLENKRGTDITRPFCQKLGGILDSNNFCVDANERVHFMAGADFGTQGKQRRCGTLFSIRTPAAGRGISEFTAYLKDSRLYQDSEDRRKAQEDRIIYEEKLAKQRQDDLNARQAIRYAEINRMQTTRGLKICKTSYSNVLGEITYVGFVEDSGQDNLKIQVSGAFITHSPTLAPGGFQPSVIWDAAANWKICN